MTPPKSRLCILSMMILVGGIGPSKGDFGATLRIFDLKYIKLRSELEILSKLHSSHENYFALSLCLP